MLYQVHVEFNSDSITVDGNEITIGVKSKPVDGQANKEVIKKMAKHFGVSSGNVSIRKGHRSRYKIIEIV
ncbi:DUF167 domain-containing protein [Candidatus Nitrosotenuis sp. DW1]|uniref:DUF167 domain-containing protein n=1 Tax=Candidatus Nitrosotenuis sp. DW1 TaxID=2259672 RepID=UPI0015C8488E|nr:DUF167 domain-containing protein [Candidatus Nitrosotenuis sp. DW1]QLH08519.1 DUF167 domain-containing protein [Candidatus Nitrosotenuis sp. DW1]